jgi:lipid-binding SYLF domain-containing protein
MSLATFKQSAGRLVLLFAGLLLGAHALAMFHEEGPSPAEQREEIQSMRQEALAQLYAEEAGAKQQIQESKGYAVFSNLGMNLFVVSTGRGGGVVRDNRSGRDIYMKMFSAGGGLGMGVKTFKAIFVFHTAEALANFVESGWDFSGQADAAVTAGEAAEEDFGATDEAMTIMQGVTVYQLTDKGLALQATLQGTKYWQDDELN